MRLEKVQDLSAINHEWNTSRFAGITRPYTAQDVERLSGNLNIEYTLAQRGATKLWQLLQERPYIATLGALTGNQAVEYAQAGLAAIYVSGWQVAADANLAGRMYPDQSLYPANSMPALVRAINNSLRRADQIRHSQGLDDIDWYLPLVADGEAGFGGELNVYELTLALVEAGAAGVHFEDQVSSKKKCGHMGGKVLLPTQVAINNLVAARLAADVARVPTLVIARTDANSATLLDNDYDSRDLPFITGRSSDGLYTISGGLGMAIARGLAYAPYADLIWCETAKPDLEEARRFAEAIHAQHPGKLLAYNCSPSFNWNKYLDPSTIARFQQELGDMGYRFQFVTLAGFHTLNHSAYQLARAYAQEGMTAYARLQHEEFTAEEDGYSATRHQQFVGAGYFDQVSLTISSETSTTALKGSTEEEQFKE